MPESDTVNRTDQTWTYPGTIKKRLRDGVTVAASDFVEPGEALVSETGRADVPSVDP
jgi:hypothetical protein